jgi:uncharacterized phiE125 gp8 family phage protein
VRLKRVSGPMEEPITRGEAKAHLRVDSDITADDDLIDDLISAAREDVEDFLGRCLVWSTWEMHLDAFPCDEIRVPRPPLLRVVSIHYVDEDGVERELGSDNFQVDGAGYYPARICPAYDRSWPNTRAQMNAVRVTFIAGYPIDDAGSPTDYSAHVPRAHRAAIKLQLANLYANRGEKAAEMPEAAKSMLWKTRVFDFG